MFKIFLLQNSGANDIDHLSTNSLQSFNSIPSISINFDASPEEFCEVQPKALSTPVKHKQLIKSLSVRQSPRLKAKKTLF